MDLVFLLHGDGADAVELNFVNPILAVGNFINTVLVAIAVESGLAVIGLSSLQESTLGTMIYWALQYQALLAGRWWWILTPVIAIMALFITLFLLASGHAQHSAARRGRIVAA